MDLLTFIGLIVGVGAVLLGQHLEGGHVDTLINGPAAIVVLGGSIGAVMLQSPLSTFLRALRMLLWIVRPPSLGAESTIERLVNWSNIARKEGLLGLESLEESESDPFVRKGLQLLIDGSEPESIRAILEVEIGVKEHHEQQAAKLFESMGGYSPTVGILGAVMGLIHVMGNLSDPSKLGSGIAVAFVATIYGVGSANLLLIPISKKLVNLVNNNTHYREMIVEGMVSIAEGENPRNIETKLKGYLH